MMVNANIGDTIFFGHYEQDNDIENGKEDVEWIVTEKKNDRIHVVSKYALDVLAYNTERREVKWEESSLYYWLNNDFVAIALTDFEKDKVCVYSDDEKEKISLLTSNYIELNPFQTIEASPTEYAISRGAITYSNGNGNWWLKSIDGKTDVSQIVSAYGGFSAVSPVNNKNMIRPAMWISTE